MDLGGLSEFVVAVLAVAFFITLILSFVGAMFGARQCTTMMRRSAAVCCGTVVGVVVAVVIGWQVFVYANYLAWLLPCPFVGALVGYVVARIMVCWPRLLGRLNVEPDR